MEPLAPQWKSGCPQARGWLVTVTQLLILLHWLVEVHYEQPGDWSLRVPLALLKGHIDSLKWGGLCLYSLCFSSLPLPLPLPLSHCHYPRFPEPC